MASRASLKRLVVVLVPFILVVQGFPEPMEIPAEIADSDAELNALFQGEPDDVLARELDSQDNDDPVVQDEPDIVPQLEHDENDDYKKGEYKAEENLENSHVTEGDIYLDKSTKEILDDLKGNNGRDAVTNPVKHWPRGRIPYVFGRVSYAVRSAFKQAINDYHRYTCIRIVPRTTQRNYIYVVSEGGCWSAIGMSRGRQKLSLGRGCEHKGTTIHELMHALGFFHEQSRRDRDRYITIHWGNINPRMKYNFQKYRHGQADTLGAPYDTGSVMHYPDYAFSINRRKTITPKRAGVRLGQRSGFSKIDLQQLNKLYKCSGGGGRVTRPPVRPATPRPPVGSCTDKYTKGNHCPNWAKLGYCKSGHRYRSFMVKNCRKSCGACGGKPRPPKPSCYDKNRSCRSWRRYCRRNNYVKRNCKKSCGTC